MGTQGVSQCFGCGVVGEGEEDTEDGNFYCFACWLIYHAARARLRRDSAHVQPARNLQGVSSAPGSAQHERSVQDASFASGRRPQLQRLGACTESCTVQNTFLVSEQRAQRACTQITTRAAHAHDLEAEFVQVGGWDASSDSEDGRAVEGSEEHFDESEHDDLAEEERSTDGEDGFGEEVDETRTSEIEGCRSSEGSDFEGENEGEGCRNPEGSDVVDETRTSEREGCRSSEGSDFEGENEGEGCRSPEGSDFAAEEGYEEDDSNAEEGHEGIWGEVQEVGSSMGNEDYDETALCARSQASRSSSSS